MSCCRASIMNNTAKFTYLAPFHIHRTTKSAQSPMYTGRLLKFKTYRTMLLVASIFSTPQMAPAPKGLYL